MLSDLLRRDRERYGLSVGQAAWRLGVSIREYRELDQLVDAQAAAQRRAMGRGV